MHLLAVTRRLQAPLICLAIACLVSAGCTVREEVVSLGKPSKAYRAESGAVLLGYNVQPTPRVTLDPVPTPEYAGWHWLIVEADTAERMMQPLEPGEVDLDKRVITVDYEGWGRNAELVPPLLEPGLFDDTPPAVGEGELTQLQFVWDEALGGVRLMGVGFSATPLIRVMPESATLRIRESNREAWLDVLKVVAVAGAVVGLIILGGSSSITID